MFKLFGLKRGKAPAGANPNAHVGGSIHSDKDRGDHEYANAMNLTIAQQKKEAKKRAKEEKRLLKEEKRRLQRERDLELDRMEEAYMRGEHDVPPMFLQQQMDSIPPRPLEGKLPANGAGHSPISPAMAMKHSGSGGGFSASSILEEGHMYLQETEMLLHQFGAAIGSDVPIWNARIDSVAKKHAHKRTLFKKKPNPNFPLEARAVLDDLRGALGIPLDAPMGATLGGDSSPPPLKAESVKQPEKPQPVKHQLHDNPVPAATVKTSPSVSKRKPSQRKRSRSRSRSHSPEPLPILIREPTEGGTTSKAPVVPNGVANGSIRRHTSTATRKGVDAAASTNLKRHGSTATHIPAPAPIKPSASGRSGVVGGAAPEDPAAVRAREKERDRDTRERDRERGEPRERDKELHRYRSDRDRDRDRRVRTESEERERDEYYARKERERAERERERERRPRSSSEEREREEYYASRRDRDRDRRYDSYGRAYHREDRDRYRDRDRDRDRPPREYYRERERERDKGGDKEPRGGDKDRGGDRDREKDKDRDRDRDREREKDREKGGADRDGDRPKTPPPKLNGKVPEEEESPQRIVLDNTSLKDLEKAKGKGVPFMPTVVDLPVEADSHGGDDDLLRPRIDVREREREREREKDKEREREMWERAREKEKERERERERRRREKEEEREYYEKREKEREERRRAAERLRAERGDETDVEADRERYRSRRDRGDREYRERDREYRDRDRDRDRDYYRSRRDKDRDRGTRDRDRDRDRGERDRDRDRERDPRGERREFEPAEPSRFHEVFSPATIAARSIAAPSIAGDR